MITEIKELDRAKKFKKKHKRDKILINRIDNKYIEILENPKRSDFIDLKSNKCPKCQRARVGDYRIVFFINTAKNRIDIIDILHRNNDYRLYWYVIYIFFMIVLNHENSYELFRTFNKLIHLVSKWKNSLQIRWLSKTH